jgi:aerobic carbon-monoxide dehydrogenase medium subunit
MYAFDFVRPRSVEEAVEALAVEDAQPIAGGQTLIPTLKARLNAPSVLVSLTGIAELRGVRREGEALVIGAGTTHAEVAREAAALFPGLSRLAGQIGDPAVRNRGTIGGSLANNDPSACYPAAAMATDAVIVTNAREIGAYEFFRGMFETALREGEIITAVRFPIPQASAYAKFAQPASRFPLTAAFVAKYADDVCVAITGASEDGVFRWDDAEDALFEDFRPEALEGVALPEEEFISDLHGSADYRAHLVRVMTARAVKAAA